MANFLQNIVYQEPSSIYLTAVSVMSLIFLGFLVFSELMGNHLKYSKFWGVNSSSASGKLQLSSRTGMLILYTPAALFGLASFVIFPDGGGIRFLMLKSAISIHFCKRVLETARCLHQSKNILCSSIY